MEILYKSAQDKAHKVPENFRQKKPGIQFRISLAMNTSKIICRVSKISVVQIQNIENVSHFIPVGVKKSLKTIGLEYVLFSHIVGIKQTIIVEADNSSKKKKKIAVFKFEGQS